MVISSTSKWLLALTSDPNGSRIQLMNVQCLIAQGFSLSAISVAQLDVRLTVYEEVAGSTPTGLATFFHGDLIMKYFVWSFSTFC